jgi:ABC-type polysaccharide/polyol phosphate transport system ATPase subunit
MSPPAIEVETLGKRYDLGEREQYRALRDVLTTAPRRIAGRLSKPVPGRRRGGERPHMWALREATFDVAEGEVLGIIGRNGAGKSTLLKVLSRITRPTEGRAVLRGRVGSLLEVGSGFHPELTGAENILLNGAILGMRKAEIEQRFDEIVEFSGVERFLDTPVKRYSTGMYMRLAFAVAAHLEPDILVLDEVLAVGDAEFQRKCIGRMSELAGGHGRTVLFVSHNLDAVRQLCHRTVWLDAGRLVDDGPTDAVVGRYLEHHTDASRAGQWMDQVGATRMGTGEARFVRARFQGTGPGGVPESGRPISFELIVSAAQRASIGSLAVTIGTLGGTILVSADPVVRSDLGLVLEPGDHTFRITIDSLPLTAGTYAVGLWMARGRGDVAWSVVDSIERAMRLDVEADPASGAVLGQAIVPCTSRIERTG